MDEWNHSWKLLEQVASSGMIITHSHPFRLSDYPHYCPSGHRGHGGAFSLGEARVYHITHPVEGGETGEERGEICSTVPQAIQAPVYVHELHLLSECLPVQVKRLERMVGGAVYRVCQEYGWMDVLWSVHMVDVYKCPRTERVSNVFQIAYCSLTRAVDRDYADMMRAEMEVQIPRLTRLLAREEKHGGRIPQAYPWYIAQSLKSFSDDEDWRVTEARHNEESVEARSGHEMNEINSKEKGRSEFMSELFYTHLRALDCQSDVSNHQSDAITSVYQLEGKDVESIRSLARSLWKKRVGVLVRSPRQGTQ